MACALSLIHILRGRGLNGVKLIVGDKCMGMLEAVGEVFPDAKYQRCTCLLYTSVGGSNNAARVVIEAIAPEDSMKIVYAGNTLSADSVSYTHLPWPKWVIRTRCSAPWPT